MGHTLEGISTWGVGHRERVGEVELLGENGKQISKMQFGGDGVRLLRQPAVDLDLVGEIRIGAVVLCRTKVIIMINPGSKRPTNERFNALLRCGRIGTQNRPLFLFRCGRIGTRKCSDAAVSEQCKRKRPLFCAPMRPHRRNTCIIPESDN